MMRTSGIIENVERFLYCVAATSLLVKGVAGVCEAVQVGNQLQKLASTATIGDSDSYNKDECWRLTGVNGTLQEDQAIRLTFSYFSVSPAEGCVNDYLLVSYVSSNSSNSSEVIVRECGQKLPDDIVTAPGRDVFLYYHSREDTSPQSDGWIMYLVVKSKPPPPSSDPNRAAAIAGAVIAGLTALIVLCGIVYKCRTWNPNAPTS